MRVRATAYAEGIVQAVGYRYLVRQLAVEHGLKGYAQNLPDQRVKIVVEGEEESVQAFLEAIKIKKPPIKVRSLETSIGKATGVFKAFTIKTGGLRDEMVEGFATGASYLGIIMDKQDSMLEKQDLMLAKQDLMLAKQDLMLEKQGSMLDKQDSMLAKQDSMLSKQDELVREVRGLKEALLAMLDERLAKIERDLAVVKARLQIS